MNTTDRNGQAIKAEQIVFIVELDEETDEVLHRDRAVVVFVDGDIVRVRYSDNGAIEDIDRPDLLIEH